MEEWNSDQRRPPPFGKNNRIMIGGDKDEGYDVLEPFLWCREYMERG